MASAPHVIVLPFPAQGHVIPLMELSHRLVAHGFKVTFVNTEFSHDRILKSLAERGGIPEEIHMVSFPDGLGPDEDRSDITKLWESLPTAISGHLEQLIGTRKSRWVIADASMIWSLEVSPKMGIRMALFSTFSAAVFALRRHVPRLIEDGIIDESGNIRRHETILLSPKMPPLDPAEIPWMTLGSSLEKRRAIIQRLLSTNPTFALADMIICNTFAEIESEALALIPNALPVGPLVADSGKPTRPAGHFWPEDLSCLKWLDKQAPGSVIYVAFGSFAVYDMTKFQELADGLELSGRPFLWVVRPNFTNEIGEDWFDEFKHRVEGKGLIVSWAPQQQVLSHPSVACFLSHCGWNSTMEGVRHGVPFLCCPFFADQYYNQSYICNVWNTGLKLCPDERGVVTKEEIKNKIEELLGEDEIRARALMWKNVACKSIGEGGFSHENFQKFVKLLRAE